VIYDVAIVGAGPAGSACAVVCGTAGLKTLILERATFPREKVCGDCVNPRCWPLLEKLRVADAVAAASHVTLRTVRFSSIAGATISIPLPVDGLGEIAIKRSIFDNLLLQRAAAAGAEVQTSTTVTHVARRRGGWEIETGARQFSSRFLVAADGRNSTVARLLGILPEPGRERVALQSHIRAPHRPEPAVHLRFRPWGYCGVAPVNEAELNVCLVTTPRRIDEAKQWAAAEWPAENDAAPVITWRTITPLTRAPVHPRAENLLLVGDAARVVEPFTGEGIYYALASGMAAGRCLVDSQSDDYDAAQLALYRGRLWINELARWTTLHPHAATLVLRLAQRMPGLLALLTRRVVSANDQLSSP
jgi:geranylgeranyl reductase family protein